MKIFCSGIGGIGLSAYAALQKHAGNDVCGSDRAQSPLTDDLESQGIRVYFDQSGESIPSDTDLLVYSEAIPPGSPERMKATAMGIEQWSYPRALGELSKDHFVIAVCGSHGKSSTTGMAARFLMEAGYDPTIVIGTKIRELDGRNWRQGKSNYFLLEACEYRRSFLHYHPNIILLTNADGDHFDYFTSMEDYHSAFVEFVGRLPADGILVIHGDDADARNIASATTARVIDADHFPMIPLRTPGEHMRRNAQLVLAMASAFPHQEGRNAEDIVSGYAGSWRRLEVKAERSDGVTVIDDYAHHPREIRASLQALREAYPHRRRITVFQPHTHDRTIKLYADFCSSFSDTDILVLTDVYDARHDTETAMVDMEQLVEDIRATSGKDVRYAPTLDDCKRTLSDLLAQGDVAICMGAGDITKLATALSA